MVRAKMRVAKNVNNTTGATYHGPMATATVQVHNATCILTFCFPRAKEKTRNRKYRESREIKLRSFCSLRLHYKLPGKLRTKLDKSYSGVGFFMGSFGRVFGKLLKCLDISNFAKFHGQWERLYRMKLKKWIQDRETERNYLIWNLLYKQDYSGCVYHLSQVRNTFQYPLSKRIYKDKRKAFLTP